MFVVGCESCTVMNIWDQECEQGEWKIPTALQNVILFLFSVIGAAGMSLS